MIDQYLAMLKAERRLTPKTLNLYASTIGILIRMDGDKNKILKHLSSKNESTHATQLGIWKQYLKYTGDSLLNDIHSPKRRRRAVSFLTAEEIERFRNFANANLFTSERLFIDIALTLGLRLSEIRSITQNSLEGDWILVQRKGDHIQRLPIPKRIRDALVNFGGFTKSQRFYQNLVARVAKGCGIQKKVSPHTLRHSFAMQTVREGHHIALLKEFLGHQSLSATEKYLHVTPENLKELIK